MNITRLLQLTLLMCAANMLDACRTHYIAATDVHSEQHARLSRDSIYVAVQRNDCTVARQRGDTVVVEHWRTVSRDRWRDRVLRDTLVLRDSVAVPVPVSQPLTRWQQLCLRAGRAMAAGCAVAVVVAALLAWLAWRHRRK